MECDFLVSTRAVLFFFFFLSPHKQCGLQGRKAEGDRLFEFPLIARIEARSHPQQEYWWWWTVLRTHVPFLLHHLPLASPVTLFSIVYTPEAIFHTLICLVSLSISNSYIDSPSSRGLPRSLLSISCFPILSRSAFFSILLCFGLLLMCDAIQYVVL